MGTYATLDDLRADPDVADDLAADVGEARIADAEDLIDRILGYYGTDPNTGRKLIPADLEAWRADKLKRATLKVAVTLVGDPGALLPPVAQTIQGPVFTLTNVTGNMKPAGTSAVRAAVALLDQANLRRLTARARA